MSLPLPSSLSPSKVSAFKDCALAFRLGAVDKLPEPSSAAATRGSLVHRALQELFGAHEPGHRTPAAARAALAAAWDELQGDPEFVELGLSAEDAGVFRTEAAALIERYFVLEDPNRVQAIGLELLLEAQLGGLRLRGIIDRLDLDDDGELVVTDYKTGRVPPMSHEQRRLEGVHFYAFLCEQMLGRRPARVQLLYLSEPVVISTVPSDQSIRGLQRQAEAVWSAVRLACEHEDFRPRPSTRCSSCGFHAYCPAVGGDLGLIPRPDGARSLQQPPVPLPV